MKTIIVDKYLVIEGRKDRWGHLSPKVRIVEKVPKLTGNEISLRLKLDLPAALFERPKLEAVMSVPAEAVPQVQITPDVTANMEKIIKDATGLTMRVSVIEHPEEKRDEQLSH